MDPAEAGTIETRIPARLDRLPWSKFHWLVVIGLGTVWILDGLEVTLVGSVADRLTEKGSGLELTAANIGTAAAFYVAGACLGALFFGQLTDRFGRKRLFMLSLGIYLVATAATAFSFSAWFFFAARFVTGAGIGGEYSAINSAIDELIPARVRGRVDLIINGSYWLGAAGGALLAIVFLNTSIFPIDLGWRLAFGSGVVFGLAILIVRRHVPESPRWLFIHGREEEAERIVDEIEAEVSEETGEELSEPKGSIKVKQRKRIPFREIASTAFRKYPRRSVLGICLFLGQAFIYNAVTFDLGTLIGTYLGVSSSSIPYYFAVFAVGNFLGPLTLGRLFDTIGRKPMVSFCYLSSAVMLTVTAVLFASESLTATSFVALLTFTFFLASAGASSAYLTVSEIFPLETRALAIAFFYAVGTAAGGITGPLLFGHLIDSGEITTAAIGLYIGAATMALGGIAEIFLGVKAEGKSLEQVAEPLTAQDGEGREGESAGAAEDEDDDARERRAAAERRAERLRVYRERERTSWRRYRPGAGTSYGSPGMTRIGAEPPLELGSEIDWLEQALEQKGPLDRRGLAAAVNARRWGPGVFTRALNEAVASGEVARVGRNRFALPRGPL